MSTPTKRPRSTKLPRLLALLLSVTFIVAAGCTPEDAALVVQAKAEQHRAALAVYNTPGAGLSDAQLARLAACESGGNPAVISKSGTYHGLYQFNQRTWNGVARSVLPDYVGVAPSAAPREVQDAMARALYKARGRSPWPVCGRRM